MHRGRFAGLFLLGSLAALALAPLTAGEHTPDHRYFVVGTVTDDQGQPLCGVGLHAFAADGELLKEATTDDRGAYSMQLHRHNGQGDAQPSQIGQRVTVHLDLVEANISKTFTLTPNSENPEGWGQATVNFDSIQGVANRCPSAGLETQSSLALLLILGIIAAIVIALLGIVLFLLMRRRKNGRPETLAGWTQAPLPPMEQTPLGGGHAMICPSCGSTIPAVAGPCPQCKAMIGFQ